MNRIYVVCGQTAAGKTGLAIKLAKLCDGEVVSADSRQVYTGLDVTSNKATTAEMDGVIHHMLDVAPAGSRYTVADYQLQARAIIDDIISRGKTPILCGGTGLYIDSVMFANYQFNQPSEKSDTNNRHSNNVVTEKFVPYFTNETIWIGLHAPREFLVAKIKKLAEQKFDCIIAEVQNMLDAGIPRQWFDTLGLESTHAIQVIYENMTREEYLESLVTKTWQYAKRQMTWFKRNQNIQWFDVSTTDQETILRSIKGLIQVTAS